MVCMLQTWQRKGTSMLHHHGQDTTISLRHVLKSSHHKSGVCIQLKSPRELGKNMRTKNYTNSNYFKLNVLFSGQNLSVNYWYFCIVEKVGHYSVQVTEQGLIPCKGRPFSRPTLGPPSCLPKGYGDPTSGINGPGSEAIHSARHSAEIKLRIHLLRVVVR